MINSIIQRMEAYEDRLAIAEPNQAFTYQDLLAAIRAWSQRLEEHQIPHGAVVSLEGDYGLDAIAAFLALVKNKNIIVPLSSQSDVQHKKCLQVAEVEYRILLDEDQPMVETQTMASHEFFSHLRSEQHPGIVLFTSGSTGESKAAVHDLSKLLEKFETQRAALRTVVFLHLDHIGGINTLLYVVSNGGAIVVPADRTPDAVSEAIAEHRAELLPTSPTFLNLLMLSEAAQSFDLSSLKLITYGTEPMPKATLDRVGEAFPDAKLQQTYGMTELGILRSKSKDSTSLWVRVGGDGFETKVVDGRLWVRARSAMLGYLNAPSPFDSDGFLDTGDQVEVDGDWLRILGRKSEMINVGGLKAYPAEIESVLLEMEDVEQAAVRGEPHPITGQIVTAVVNLGGDETVRDFKTRMRVFCRGRLPAFAIPSRITLSDSKLHSTRFKTLR
ncbi:MAG: long-chain fatty acid--CoA ligase [Planctomycetaceae bacterium]|nr:long-chain fatty acid--CoA ligase [Planctomycetaceae bacterium]